jgi:hypothetical protein
MFTHGRVGLRKVGHGRKAAAVVGSPGLAVRSLDLVKGSLDPAAHTVAELRVHHLKSLCY